MVVQPTELKSPFVEERLPADHALQPLINSSLVALGWESGSSPQRRVMWSEERYNLQFSSLYRSLSSGLQQEILEDLTKANLTLAYYIEKVGIYFGGRMASHAQSDEEREYYSLFSSEEVIHMRSIENYIGFKKDPIYHYHPLMGAIQKTLDFNDCDSMIFIIQVLLEGFGISHYSNLREFCLEPRLKEVFQKIIWDEARHHGSGLAMTANKKLLASSSDFIFDVSKDLIQSLKRSCWIIRAFEHVGVPLSEEAKETLLAEIKFSNTTEHRMHKLEEIFRKGKQARILERLKNDKVFYLKT